MRVVYSAFLALVGGLPLTAAAAELRAEYFSLGPDLVEQFEGTGEFKELRLEFVRSDSGDYDIASSGDQSPSHARLVVGDGYITWVLGSSGETWLKFKRNLRSGDTWHNHLRGWNQTYRVAAKNLTLSVPAGTFRHCVKIDVTWVAHEHDLEGPQRISLYLAPQLAVIKRQVYSSGVEEHEEVLRSFTRPPRQ